MIPCLVMFMSKEYVYLLFTEYIFLEFIAQVVIQLLMVGNIPNFFKHRNFRWHDSTPFSSPTKQSSLPI
jgi:hypothetical protein